MAPLSSTQIDSRALYINLEILVYNPRLSNSVSPLFLLHTLYISFPFPHILTVDLGRRVAQVFEKIRIVNRSLFHDLDTLKRFRVYPQASAAGRAIVVCDAFAGVTATGILLRVPLINLNEDVGMSRL